MTTTIDDERPERAWGVAAVPTHPFAASPPARPAGGSADQPDGRPAGQPVGGQLYGRPEALTGPLGPLAVMPAAPSRSDRHRRAARGSSGSGWSLSRLRTLVVVCVLVAAAGVGGYQVIRQRLAARAFVDLGSVVLTADAVPVGFAEAVVVTRVGVAQHARVTAGQVLAVVTSATGTEETLRAPVAGTVAGVEVGVGGVARGGEPIVMLYDQARLTFQADVALESLRRMRLGMTTYIEGPGLSRRIAATLDHVVPIVGTGQSTVADRLTVVLVPTDADRAVVSSLVPGLRFNARVDTNTATGAVQAVNTG